MAIDSKSFTKVLIIRMRAVPAIDVSAIRKLRELVTKAGKNDITVIFSHVNEQPMHAFEKDGFVDFAGKDNFRTNIIEALDYANSLVSK